MEELLLFLMSFVFVFLIYQIFIVKKTKKNLKKNITVKDPIEITYLRNYYHLDIEKITYKKLLLVISIVSSFDISLVVTIIMLLKNFLLEIIVGLISTLLIIYVSYHLVYLFYKRKGLIINE